jgi:hypothetical protein
MGTVLLAVVTQFKSESLVDQLCTECAFAFISPVLLQEVEVSFMSFIRDQFTSE